MMGELTIVGDPHAKHHNLIQIVELFELVENLGNPVIWLGDMLDTKEVIRGKCQNLLYDQCKKSKLQHTILVGNHDWFNDDCMDHSLKTLDELPNVSVIDKPVVQDNIAFLPFYKELDLFKKAFKTVSKPGVEFLFMHQGVINFDFGNGRLETHGVEEAMLQASQFKLIISGHFHKYQESGKFIYLGTPFSHTFGEANQKKFIGMFNPTEVSFDTLETPFPQHLSFEADVSNASQATTLRAELNRYATTGDHLRAILTGPMDKIAQFPKEEYPRVKFLERPTIFNTSTEIKDTQTPEQQFVKWATKIKKLDTKLIKAGVELLRAS